MFKKFSSPNTWREYQQQLKRSSRLKYFRNRLPWIGSGAVFLLLLVSIWLTWSSSWLNKPANKVQKSPLTKDTEEDRLESIRLSRTRLNRFWETNPLDLSPVLEQYIVESTEGQFQVETSLNMNLQNHIEKILQHSLTILSAVVVMKPGNGQILALAEYQNTKMKIESNGNLCLKADFPAASLFKIISAAAAIEAKGFNPEKPLYFSGRKYTLYKDQLHKKEPGRFMRQTNLKRAFSGSINPVFGKIGIYDLGQSLIEEYARKFFFKQRIPLELPIAISPIAAPEDDFGVAELASGFNKLTKISPLHATLITASIANNGEMMDPWLIKSIKNQNGEVVYQVEAVPLTHPIKAQTAEKLKDLMNDTIQNGTCRRTFLSMRQNKSFAKLELGAKTGTINDENDRIKYDWITAYALPAVKEDGICITILTVHGEKLGIRAKELAKDIIQFHFAS